MKTTKPQLKQPRQKCTCGACDLLKPKLPTGTHRLKVQQKYTPRNYDYVPSLLLAGKWLDKIGFKPSMYVIVFEKEGSLIISLEEEKTTQ